MVLHYKCHEHQQVWSRIFSQVKPKIMLCLELTKNHPKINIYGQNLYFNLHKMILLRLSLKYIHVDSSHHMDYQKVEFISFLKLILFFPHGCHDLGYLTCLNPSQPLNVEKKISTVLCSYWS